MEKILKPFKSFDYFGIYVEAYENERGEIKKKCIQPARNIREETEHYMGDIYDKTSGKYRKPNGIQIDTSNLSIIDVDRPDECFILDDLKRDCKFTVKTNKGYHFYFKKHKEILKEEKCGVVDINLQQLWFVPTYINKASGEEYHYKFENKEEIIKMPQYAVKYCNIEIKKVLNAKKQEPVTKCKQSTEVCNIIKPDILIEKFDIPTMRTIFKIFYDKGYLNKYDGWSSIAWMGRHLNNTEESFKLFDKYSRKVEKYANEPESVNRKCFFGAGEYNINFDENGVLIKLSKLAPDDFKKTLKKLYKGKYEDEFIHFNEQYIYPEDGENDYIFEEWNEKYKVLCIKSSYGTGKTYGFKKLIKKYKYKKILFITYRQSLAHNLQNELSEEYGFKNYLDKDVNIKETDRLLLQLDSLGKLNASITHDIFDIDDLNDLSLITQTDNIKQFDLIVLDEIEGLLNHLSYDKLDQFYIHSILMRLMKKATKVLCLDGDMSDRSFDFIRNLTDSYKIYVNNYKTIQKNFIFTRSIDYFNEQLDEDIKDGKKIVIVSMTKSDSENYRKEYEDKYNVIIHNSLEKNSYILKNANEEWTKADILIYSPTVEAGIDYNVVNHFDKCYSILTNRSTSFRAYSQMLNRVRHYNDNNIICLLPPTITWEINEMVYRYDEFRLCKYKGIETSSLVDILIHNDVEKINSNNYFAHCLVKLITEKGHTYEYLDDKPLKRQKQPHSFKDAMIKEIIKADDVDEAFYNELLNRQYNKIELTRDEKAIIDKYYYKKTFLIDTINEEFLKTHYLKTQVVGLHNRLMKDESEKIKSDKNGITNFKSKVDNLVLQIIQKLGHDIKDHNIIKVSDVKFDVASKDIINFINNPEFKQLFNKGRVLKTINLLSILNDTFNSYGLRVIKTRSKKGGGDNAIYHYNISIDFIDIIKGYRERVLQKQENQKNDILNGMEEGVQL